MTPFDTTIDTDKHVVMSSKNSSFVMGPARLGEGECYGRETVCQCLGMQHREQAERIARLLNQSNDAKPASCINPESIGYLDAIVSLFACEHNWQHEDDPDAVHKALREARAVIAELRARHPACMFCGMEPAEPDCERCKSCEEEIAGKAVSDEVEIPL